MNKMTAKIIDGKQIAAELREKLKKEAKELKIKPGLAVILVGDDPASQVYVRNKHKACQEIDFYSEVHTLDKLAGIQDILKLIDKLNQDKKIHGMLVQLPLPEQLQNYVNLVQDTVLPFKDADGLHPVNMGNLLMGNNLIVPATPKGVIKLIESTGEKIEGKNAVVVGRSNLVGKPVAMLLLQKNATVTMCHSRTKNLGDVTKKADILVVAMGKAKFIKADMVKKGAIVIDVGTNKDENGKLVGDVDFEKVKEIAGFITPVPGGVGPMTIACLLENTLEAAKRKLQ